MIYSVFLLFFGLNYWSLSYPMGNWVSSQLLPTEHFSVIDCFRKKACFRKYVNFWFRKNMPFRKNHRGISKIKTCFFLRCLQISHQSRVSPFPFTSSIPVLHRCIPTGKKAPGEVVRDAYDLLNSWSVAQQLFSDLYTTWPIVLLMCILAFGM